MPSSHHQLASSDHPEALCVPHGAGFGAPWILGDAQLHALFALLCVVQCELHVPFYAALESLPESSCALQPEPHVLSYAALYEPHVLFASSRPVLYQASSWLLLLP